MRISDWSSDVCSSDLRTSGNFISADHEEKFHKVGSALDFIRHINSTELVRNESPSLEARTDQPIALRNAHSHPPSNIEIQNLATTIRKGLRSKEAPRKRNVARSEEQTYELQSLMRIPYAVFS